MQSGYYSSAAGMVAQFNKLDTISNNLANVNTTGFKEDNLIVGDFMRIYKDARDELPNENNTKEGAKFLNRTLTKAPQIVDSYTDFTTGRLEPTNNSLDFALSNEDEFFLVKTPNGLRLTKDGSFTKNDEGKLVTKSGYEVLPADYFDSNGVNDNISFSDTENIIEVDKNGQIYKNIPNTAKMTLDTKFFIAKPDDLALVKKEGDSLYNYDAISTLKSVDESGGVMQGFVEDSNVNAVKMMTQMIETNRLVGMYQKAMQVQMDDMNNDAINKLAKKA